MKTAVRNKNVLRLYVTIVLSLPLFTGVSQQFGPANPSCIELGTCDFFEAPFDNMLEPYTSSWGDYIYPAVWGLIIFVIWSRVENPYIPAIIGVALAVFAQGLFSNEGRLIGYALLALSIGLTIYQLVTVRVHYPTN